jgi:hypothetical protein
MGESSSSLIQSRLAEAGKRMRMFRPIIGRRPAIVILVYLLVAAPPNTLAEHFFRGSRSRHHGAIDGCASLDTENSCLEGGRGVCDWNPNVGCAPSLAPDVGNGHDEGGMRASRYLQTTRRPTTRRPTSPRPTTRRPTSPKPTNVPTTSKPTTSKPSSKPPVSRFGAAFFVHRWH